MGYISNRSFGALKKILADDVERIEVFIAHGIPDFIKGLSLPFIVLAYLFTVDWRLALISFVPLILVGILVSVTFGSPKTKELMENVGFVFQDNRMFYESFYENIRMGQNKTKEEVIAAAKVARCHDFIMKLPDGYATHFGSSVTSYFHLSCVTTLTTVRITLFIAFFTLADCLN